ncbi:MAG: glutathione S-transferase family protein, partial [Paracoccaceae bacterium]
PKSEADMYTLHYSPDTASLIVRLVLRELNLTFTEQLIDREAGALDIPAYRALHPLGKIPAMETPDGAMFETAAILLYLSDRHPGLAPAPDSPDRAAFLKWLFFTSTNLHPTLLELFYPDRVAGPDCAAAVLTHAHARMESFLNLLDQMIDADKPTWLSDTQPSLLGYYLAVLIRWLATYGPGHPSYFIAKDFPALNRVLAHLETRPAALDASLAESLGPTIFTNPAY